jgi:transcription elongation factor GreA
MDYYLTEERLAELKNELNDLKTNQRAEIAERLKRAKELGDLSENSEYIEAREEQRRVETRIMELEDMVRRAEIIKKSNGKGGVVNIGSTIEVSKNGQKAKFTIVGSNEARPEAGLISNESPLGKAFIGKKAGESAEITAPSGKIAYKIISIE